jgi:hypothetical protein
MICTQGLELLFTPISCRRFGSWDARLGPEGRGDDDKSTCVPAIPSLAHGKCRSGVTINLGRESLAAVCARAEDRSSVYRKLVYQCLGRAIQGILAS